MMIPTRVLSVTLTLAATTGLMMEVRLKGWTSQLQLSRPQSQPQDQCPGPVLLMLARTCLRNSSWALSSAWDNTTTILFDISKRWNDSKLIYIEIDHLSKFDLFQLCMCAQFKRHNNVMDFTICIPRSDESCGIYGWCAQHESGRCKETFGRVGGQDYLSMLSIYKNMPPQLQLLTLIYLENMYISQESTRLINEAPREKGQIERGDL